MNARSPLSGSRRTALAALGLFAAPGFGLRAALAQAPGGLPALFAASKSAVFAVGVHSKIQKPPFRFTGTCFAIEGGRLITCAHVVPALDAATREVLAVVLPLPEGQTVVEVKVVASNRETDLAVLEPIRPLPASLPLLRLSNSLAAEGSEILMIGFPIGSALGLIPTAHRGIVAAVVPMAMPQPTTVGLDPRNVVALRSGPVQVLQLDATAYPGNSGGPIIDIATGRVVGVVSLTMVKNTRESAMTSPSGISYAVPVQHLAGMIPGQ